MRRYIYHIFRQINPIKKYRSFTSTELNVIEITNAYCRKNEIILVGGKYYQYAKMIEVDTTAKIVSSILLKKGNKIMHQIEL